MAEEQTGVVDEVESPATEDVIEDSSAQEEAQPEEATSQEAVEEEVKEPPFHEHPRWQEVQKQKQEAAEAAAKAKAEAEYYRGLAEAREKSAQPQQQDDPYAGMTAEEKAWYQNLDKRVQSQIQKEVTKAREEERTAVQTELQSYQKMVGNVIAKDFMKSHPEIKKGSAEMESVTKKAHQYVQMGMELTDALEDAYRNVMFDYNAQKAVEKSKQQTQVKAKQKMAANVETQSIPQQGMPTTESKGGNITMDDLTKTAKELGIDI